MLVWLPAPDTPALSWQTTASVHHRFQISSPSAASGTPKLGPKYLVCLSVWCVVRGGLWSLGVCSGWVACGLRLVACGVDCVLRGVWCCDVWWCGARSEPCGVWRLACGVGDLVLGAWMRGAWY